MHSTNQSISTTSAWSLHLLVHDSRGSAKIRLYVRSSTVLDFHASLFFLSVFIVRLGNTLWCQSIAMQMALTWLLSNEMVQTQMVGLENENFLRGLLHWMSAVVSWCWNLRSPDIVTVWQDGTNRVGEWKWPAPVSGSEIRLVTKRPNQCL